MALRCRAIDDAQLTKRQKSSAGFLSIPPELRLKIYGLVLTGSSYHILSDKPLSNDRVIRKSVRCFMPPGAGASQHAYCFDATEPINLCLLMTCRIVYKEASLMPYAGNTFKFIQGPEAYRLFVANRTLQQLQQIRSMEIVSEGPRYGEKKREDIWLNMCTTMESMTNLKHLRLALWMV